MKHLLPLMMILPVLFSQCTNNPFFGEDDTAQDKYVVSGHVSLSDQASPENAYVWVQDLEISSRCNSAGNFTLRIPKTAQYEGLNGSYTVYFYVGNYKFRTAGVVVRNGQFEYGQQNITSDGHFDEPIILSKMIDIETSVDLHQIASGINQEVNILLKMVSIDSFVSIITQVDRDQFVRGYYLKRLNSDLPPILLYDPLSIKPGGYTISGVTQKETKHLFLAGSIESGDYEIIPYVRVLQQGLPEELLISLGDEVNEYALDFLNVPYIRTHAQITFD